MTRGWIPELLSDMLKEEWRLQKAFVGGFGTIFFPLLIMSMSLLLIVILPSDDITGNGALIFFHLIASLYGVLVGGIALLSDLIMSRRMGQVNLLLRLCEVEPIDYRKVLGIFYVKEIIFYVLYSIIPLSFGVIIGSIIRGIPLPGALMMSFTLFLAFLLGMSISFLLSSLQVRSPFLALIGLFMIMTPALMVWPLEILPVQAVFHPYGFWVDRSPLMPVLSIVEAIIFSTIALLLSRQRLSSPSVSYKPELLHREKTFSRITKASYMLSKEWLELKRSGTLAPVVLGFGGPLLAVYGLSYLFRTVLSADLLFNSVFYGSLVGFFGVMTYSWLTNIEHNSALNILPVSVPSVVEIKVILFFLISSILTSFYVLLVSVLNGDLYLFPLALGVALANNTYTVSVTAWLTGLRANTMLLDGGILSIFSLLIVPPLITLVIISFFISDGSVIGALVVSILSLLLLAVSAFLLGRVRKRWKGTTFTI